MEWWGGRGTQSYPDYIRLESLSMAHRVAGYVLPCVVKACKLMEDENRFVCLEVGGVRFGGVYGRCGERGHDMEQWLQGIREVVGVGCWALLRDWNVHNRYNGGLLADRKLC